MLNPAPEFLGPPVPPVSGDERRPFWSVMMPVYNPTDHLAQSLRSILAQDPGREQMQIRIIDDCSARTDVEAKVREIAGERVEYVRNGHNLGGVANFNACFAQARGLWVHMLHQDDFVHPGFYARLRAGLETCPEAGAAFCRHAHVDAEGRTRLIVNPERSTAGLLADFLERECVDHRTQFPASVFERATLERVGGFRYDIGPACDVELWLRLAVFSHIWYEPEVLASFRSHGGNWTSRTIRSGENTASSRRALTAARQYMPREKADQLFAGACRRNAEIALGFVQGFLRAGDLSGALAQTREALLFDSGEPVLNLAAACLREDAAQMERMLQQRLADLRRADPAGALAAAREWRKELAGLWLALPAAAVPVVYGRIFGGVQRLLNASGVRGGGAPAQEREELKGLGWRAEALGVAYSAQAVGHLLAGLLYLPMEELGGPAITGQMPSWLRAEVEQLAAGGRTGQPAAGGSGVNILGSTGRGGLVISFTKTSKG